MMTGSCHVNSVSRFRPPCAVSIIVISLLFSCLLPLAEFSVGRPRLPRAQDTRHQGKPIRRLCHGLLSVVGRGTVRAPPVLSLYTAGDHDGDGGADVPCGFVCDSRGGAARAAEELDEKDLVGARRGGGGESVSCPAVRDIE